MKIPVNSLKAHLLQSGIILRDDNQSAELNSPWYVKALLAFSGWLAASFLLGFLGLLFVSLFKSAGGSLVLGSVLITASYFMLRELKSDFVEHLAIAFSFSGQALVIWAIVQFLGVHVRESITAVALISMLIALFEIVLAFVIPSFVHRVMSIILVPIAIFIALSVMGFYYLFSGVVMSAIAWVWLNEFNHFEQIRKMRAIGYGLVLSLLFLQGTLMYGDTQRALVRYNSDFSSWLWLGNAFDILVISYVLFSILVQNNQTIRSKVGILTLIGIAVLSVLSLEVGGVTEGMLILILGFMVSNRILQGLGIFSLLVFISSYYYMLDETLLDKSLSLLFVGISLLIGRWVLFHIVLKPIGVQRDA